VPPACRVLVAAARGRFGVVRGCSRCAGLSVLERFCAWRLREVNQAVTAPAAAREPLPRLEHGAFQRFVTFQLGPGFCGDARRRPRRETRRASGARLPLVPAVEPGARGVRVDTVGQAAPRVSAEVREHVHESVPHLARRTQCAPVPAIRPKSSRPREQLIHVASDADRNAAHAGGKLARVRGFDDEMHVIPLHRKLNDPEPRRRPSRCAHDREPHRRKQELTTKRRERRSQSNVNGLSLPVGRTRPMRRARATRDPLSPSATPRAPAPRSIARKPQRKLELPSLRFRTARVRCCAL
jgi:hypothetical protein